MDPVRLLSTYAIDESLIVEHNFNSKLKSKIMLGV